MELEFHQIELKYKGLRISNTGDASRLMASLAEHGQLSPVIVVLGGNSKYVLIDGYQRVEALKKLHRDKVEAILLSMTEKEALLHGYREMHSGKYSAIEEGWLIKELVITHGMEVSEVAGKLQRSASWISRRLGLVQELSERVQEWVRKGEICPYVAARYLVPMARVKMEDCELLATGIKGQGLCVRDVGQIYEGWRAERGENRARILTAPTLYLKALQLEKTAETPSLLPDKEEGVIALLKRLSNILRQLVYGVKRLGRGGGEGIFSEGLLLLWDKACGDFAHLTRIIMEVRHDRAGDADSDSKTAR